MGRKRLSETITKTKKKSLHYYSTKDGQILTWCNHISYGDPYYNYDDNDENLIYLGEFKSPLDFIEYLAKKQKIAEFNCCSYESGWDVTYLSRKLCVSKEKVDEIRREYTNGEETRRRFTSDSKSKHKTIRC